MKKVCIVTGARSEWSGLRMFARLARHSSAFDLSIIAAGMHFSRQHGETWKEIEADGFAIAYGTGWDGDPVYALGMYVDRIGVALEQLRPNAVLVEGDRIEALAATLAGAYSGIEVYHAGGGDLSSTVDNSARHAISHFASLHFVSHDAAADRLHRMDVPGDIHVTGGLGIDAIMQTEFPPREQVLADLGLPPGSRYLLVCFHPETGHEAEAGDWMGNILLACGNAGPDLIITYPNSDPGSEAIIAEIEPFARAFRKTVKAFPNLGTRYLPALRYADALVGNSSSGLYEAPSLKVPVVNVGHRQDGRLRAWNVLGCDYSYEAIKATLDTALNATGWRYYMQENTVNPYGDGHAAERMMEIIERRLGE